MLGRSRKAAAQLATAVGRSFAVGPAGACSGVPEAQLQRKVVVFSPARSACQQGKSGMGSWKISFGENQRWENPLMGWTSTGDALSHVGRSALEFNTKKAACDFAARQGWAYEVVHPNAASLGSSIIRGAGKRGTRVKQYGDNYAVGRRGVPVWEAGQCSGSY